MDLGSLIAHVEAADDMPLGRLAAAVHTEADLDALGDTLVGHFVDEARRAGHSWSDIGGALGVSKQAAQQRFVPTGSRFARLWRRLEESGAMTRFTPRARNVVVLAAEEARRSGHEAVDTEHLLLGVLHEGLAADVLGSFGVGLDDVRGRVEAIVGRSDQVPSGNLPFTTGAKKVLDASLPEALRLGHNYIGTEHVLLALGAHPGIGAQVLMEVGADPGRVRAEVVRRLGWCSGTSR